MKRLQLIAVLVGFVAVAALSSPAHAHLYMMRHGSNVYPAVATPMPPVPSAPMAPTAASPSMGPMVTMPMPGRRYAPMVGAMGRPHRGVNVYPSVSSPRPHPDGPNLYQYVRSNPIRYTDSSGLAVDPGKDCKLFSNSDWSGKKPVHYWLTGVGQELWDFGPDYDWMDNRYGNHDYSMCGLLKYCRGEANWGNNSYAGRVGRHAHNSLKLQGDFLFWEAKLKAGPKKGTACKCATCGDIKGCLNAVRKKWDGTRYYHLERNCATFIIDAMNKCCLKEW